MLTGLLSQTDLKGPGQGPQKVNFIKLLSFAVNTCEDANQRLCRKIIKFYGNGVCSTHDKVMLYTVQNVCQSTCGFCTNECEDQFEDLCTEYGEFCGSEGDIGDLLKEVCPKTCKSCHLRPSKEENNLVVIHG